MKLMALSEQMDMLQEGGLLDDGGSKDPVSGNDVPVGSLKKEVRDDIPAQLSEGEFVMPADVVRYHGLDKMMALRDEAKSGLQRMEDMGQMGNSEQATIPDGVPFNMEDLELEEEPREMQIGGFVPAVPQVQPLQYQQSQFANYMPQYSAPPVVQPPMSSPVPMQQYTPVQQAFTPLGPQFETLPTYGQVIKEPEMRKYVNAEGQVMMIPFIDGVAQIAIPPGYLPADDATTPPVDTTPPPVTAPPVQTRPQGRDDPSDDQDPNPAGLTRGQSQVAALTQLDPSFASTIEAIDKKYPDPGIAGLLSPISTIISGFKRNNEINQAVKNYDYAALGQPTSEQIAAGKGNTLTADEVKNTVNTLGQEIYTGYRDAETGTVSGQKDMRSLGQIASEFINPKTYDDIDEFGNIADDGTMPTTTQVQSATVRDPGKTVQQSAEDFREQERIRAGLIDPDQAAAIQQERIIQTANALLARDNRLDATDAMQMAIAAETTGTVDPVLNLNRATVSPAGFSVEKTDGGTKTTSTIGDQTGMEELANKMRASVSAATPSTTARRFSPGAMGGRIDTDRMTDDPAGIADSGPVVREDKVDPGLAAAVQRETNKQIDRQTQNYRNKGYSSSAAKSAAKNKVAADAAAKRQAQERGDPPDRVNKTSAVTDSKGNAVTSTNAQGKKTVVTSAPREEKSDSPGGRWCCSQMVHHGVWTHQGEFARLTVWSMKQPNWWRSGYDVWGKFLAKTFLRKQGFWSGIMQSFFDYHIRNKPYTWRTALAHVMVYPGVFICGHIWTKVPETVRLAKFEELNN